MGNTLWSRVVCVDWGKETRKRRAWMADVARRSVVPLEVDPTVDGLLAYAVQAEGRVLCAFDAVLGVPAAYMERARAAVTAWREFAHFPAWLAEVSRGADFFLHVDAAAQWRPQRPFLAVPAGQGALTAFLDAAGHDLRRQVERETHAKSPFIVSGIPGSVGSGTRALWQELAPWLGRMRAFALWPFEGSLGELTRAKVVVGEFYPRVCYSLALAPELPAPLETIAKTKAEARDAAVDRLVEAPWIRRHAIMIDALDLCRAGEDDFDAMISAAGILRCLIEEHPLERLPHHPWEGGMLGMGALSPSSAPKLRGTSVARLRTSLRATALSRLPCPIPGCGKVFVGGRGGWDSHVGALRAHPAWQPHVTAAELRRALFKSEFSAWFA